MERDNEKDYYCLHICHQLSQKLTMTIEKVDGNRKLMENL